MTEQELFTVELAAAKWGVTVACVRRWILEQRINVVRLGKLVRVPETEIQRVVDNGVPPRTQRTPKFGQE